MGCLHDQRESIYPPDGECAEGKYNEEDHTKPFGGNREEPDKMRNEPGQVQDFEKIRNPEVNRRSGNQEKKKGEQCKDKLQKNNRAQRIDCSHQGFKIIIH